MTKDEAKKLVYSELDNLRSVVCTTADQLHARTETLDRWLCTASKKECLAELVYLLANNRKGAV